LADQIPTHGEIRPNPRLIGQGREEHPVDRDDEQAEGEARALPRADPRHTERDAQEGEHDRGQRKREPLMDLGADHVGGHAPEDGIRLGGRAAALRQELGGRAVEVRLLQRLA
jgi:hypothetical protein